MTTAWTVLQKRATVKTRKAHAPAFSRPNPTITTSGRPSPSATNGAVTHTSPGGWNAW